MPHPWSRAESVDATPGLPQTGRRALRRLGGWLSTAYALTALLMIAWTASPDELGPAVAAAGAVTSLGVLIWTAGMSASRVVSVLAVASVVVAVIATMHLEGGLAWGQKESMVSLVVSCAGAGMALTSGSLYGLATLFAGTAAWLVTAASIGGSVNPMSMLGSLVTVLVAVSVATLCTRGFLVTERALAAAEAAASARVVAKARWGARRQLALELHDTVLDTLTILAHGGRSLPPEAVRDACRRDVTKLHEAGPCQPVARQPVVGLPPPSPATSMGVLAADWSRRGLQVSVFGEAVEAVLDQLAPDTRSALVAALDACLSNVSRHSGVRAASVVLVAVGGSVDCVVLDEGVGFDPSSAPLDRLGLRESVTGRVRRVGGRVTVRSRPGMGTTVVMKVPIGELTL